MIGNCAICCWMLELKVFLDLNLPELALAYPLPRGVVIHKFSILTSKFMKYFVDLRPTHTAAHCTPARPAGQYRPSLPNSAPYSDLRAPLRVLSRCPVPPLRERRMYHDRAVTVHDMVVTFRGLWVGRRNYLTLTDLPEMIDLGVKLCKRQDPDRI